jgi:acetyl esterase/lipase
MHHLPNIFRFLKTSAAVAGLGVLLASIPASAQCTAPGGKPCRLLWAGRYAPVVSPKPSNLADTSTYTKTDTTKNPWLAEYVPTVTKNGVAIIVIPGGGYDNLSPWGSEGRPAADTLIKYGYTIFILHYRLKPYGYPHAMWDVQRAVRWVRANAATYGVDPNRIGVLGFSAGGHVASTATTHFDAGLLDSNATNGPHWHSGPKDSIDLVSSRPNFSGLIYPMTTMVQYVPGTTTAFAYKPGRDIYIGTSPTQSLVDYTSNEKQVTSQTPPAFINWGTSDGTVNPLNSTAYRDSLISKGVKYKTVIVSGGGHSPSTARLDSMRTWLNAEGFLSPSVALRPARLRPPAHALVPTNAPDALGRISIRPVGPTLKIPTEQP